MYPDDGPAPPCGDSSSIGVIGGGGVSGVGPATDARRGEDAAGAFHDVCFGRRKRCDERLGLGDGGEEGDPEVFEPWLLARTPPPTSSRMLPRSLPYAGGGARVPTLGARPHFFTLASIKTKPA